MRRLILGHTTEVTLLAVMILLSIGLSFGTDRFLTVSNAFDVLNVSAVNIIFAVGLLVVLISGGIDISFAVAASVVQYVTVLAITALGGGNWALGFVIAGGVGISLGLVNAFLVHQLKIISIVATISTFNIFFGLLMFFTKGVSIYNLPDWLSNRVVLFEHEMPDGSWVELTLPVVVMVLCCFATWFLMSRTHDRPQALCFRRQSRGRPPVRHQYRRHACHLLRLAGADGGDRRADAGALCPGGRPQRALRPRTRRARGHRSRRGRGLAAARAPCSAACSAC